eukprot:jgi/Picre1/34704/NNA_002172.t1
MLQDGDSRALPWLMSDNRFFRWKVAQCSRVCSPSSSVFGDGTMSGAGRRGIHSTEHGYSFASQPFRMMHSSAWYVYRVLRGPATAAAGSAADNWGSCSVLGSSLDTSRSVVKSNVPVEDIYADAEGCDEAIEDLENVRRRVQSWKKLPPGHVPLTVRSAEGGAKSDVFEWWGVVKMEAKHYWLGLKLLGKDTKIASRLLGRVLSGKTLSRRERQQLTRTTADIFRLVPMMVFLVVPFMELLLPVALKLFPNMLPSTFEDKLKKEEDMKKRVAARLEIARTSAAELYGFMQRVRAGENVDTSELLKFAKLFNDELTLDNLERVQLVSLCRFVGISPFGTDAFLKTRLRSHLIEIKSDDQEIQEEGIENLTEDELRQACRARGMRAPFGEGAVKFMRQQLEEWLDWSLNRSLPSSLLLLSRAFTVTSPVGQPSSVDVSSIRETLSTMPEEVVEDVELFATSSADKSDAYERKLELFGA